MVRPERKPRTYQGYEGVVRLYLVPELGSKRLAKLAAQDVRVFITRIRAQCLCCKHGVDAARDEPQCCAPAGHRQSRRRDLVGYPAPRCVAARPDVFGWSAGAGSAALSRAGLIVPALPETPDNLAAVRDGLRARTSALRRSVHLRHVDAGSDGTEEWEILALLNPVYDVHRLGIFGAGRGFPPLERRVVTCG